MLSFHSIQICIPKGMSTITINLRYILAQKWPILWVIICMHIRLPSVTVIVRNNLT